MLWEKTQCQNIKLIVHFKHKESSATWVHACICTPIRPVTAREPGMILGHSRLLWNLQQQGHTVDSALLEPIKLLGLEERDKSNDQKKKKCVSVCVRVHRCACV